MDGEENDVESARAFAQTLFALQAAGARTITGAHHAPKGFGTSERMTLENILRGSGDIGAMLCTAWGVRQIDADASRVYVQNVKARDFQPCAPFVLEGRPHLDENGNFLMLEPPGMAQDVRLHATQGRSIWNTGAGPKDRTGGFDEGQGQEPERHCRSIERVQELR